VGWGEFGALGAEAALLGTRALIVLGRGWAVSSGLADRAVELLREAGVEAVVFDGVPPEPEVGTLEAARDAQREAVCDLVVAIGGGSVLDVGKAVGGLALEGEPASAYLAGREVPASGLPIAAVATTSGTGSEVTPNAVLIDPAGSLKQSIRGESLRPAVALVDAELTMSCPPSVTADSGLDALTQAIESFVSRGACPVTEALSRRAIELAWSALPTACEQGSDREAREAMANASFMAGVALANARLGAVHGLAHPIGVMSGLGHGRVCGTLLPAVLRRNWSALGAKRSVLGRILGEDPVGALRGLLGRLGLPERFAFRPSEEQMEQIAAYAFRSGSSRANPVVVDEAYVRGVMADVAGQPA
jgi:alcohol dehydrogenase class IV